MAKYNEKRLPAWAQIRLNLLRIELEKKEEEMRVLRQTHVLLAEYDWFTINGPPKDRPYPEDTITLWMLFHNHPQALCTIGTDSLLLVGRKRK